MRIGIATITSTALVAGTLVAVPAHPLLPVTAVAQAQESITSQPLTAEDIATARAFGIDLDLLNLAVLDAIEAEDAWPNSSDTENDALTLEALQALRLDLGGSLNDLPLIKGGSGAGLLDLGGQGVGLLGASADAPGVSGITASAGVLAESGSIGLDPNLNTGTGPAKVDVLALTSQLGLDPVVSALVQELNLEIGAIGSEIEKNGDTYISDYTVADLNLVLKSSLLSEINTTLAGVGTELDQTIEALAGSQGLVNSITGVLGPVLNVIGIGTPTVTIESNLQGLVDNLISAPLMDGVSADDSLVIIDLAQGDIRVNLENLHGADLNGLDPNTQLNTAQLAQITSTVDDLLDGLLDRVSNTLNEGVLDTHLVIDLPAQNRILGTVIGGIKIDSDLGGLLGSDGFNAPVITYSGTVLSIVGGLLEPAVNGIIRPLGGAIQNLLEGEVADIVDTVLRDDVLNSLLTGLSPLLDTVLSDVLLITINKQENGTVAGQQSRKVTALDVQVIPVAGAAPVVQLGLAASQVSGPTTADLDAFAPAITVIPEEGPFGEPATVTIAGENLVYVDGAGTPVSLVTGLTFGAEVVPAADITANADGSLTVKVPVVTADAGETSRLVDVTLTTGGGEGTDTYTYKADAVIVVTLEEIADKTGVVGTPIVPFDFDVSPADADITVAGLPAGITFDAGTGQVSGTPTTATVTPVEVTVTATSGTASAVQTFNFTVTEAPVTTVTVADIADQTITLGDAITDVIPAVTPAGAEVTVTGLPDGVTFDGTTISGTPTAPGTADVTVTATIGGVVSAPVEFTITTNPEVPSLDAIADQTITLGESIADVTPVVTPAGTDITVDGLPDGVTFDGTTISGTPTVAGSAEVTVTATNAAGPIAVQFTITTNPVAGPAAPSLDTIASQTITLGESIADVTPVATPAGTDVTVTGLPDGVTFDGTTISGTPTAVGNSVATVTATNTTGSASVTFSITVNTPAVDAPVIEPIDDAEGVVGEEIDEIPVRVTPDTSDVQVDGLPDGVEYNPGTGVIEGVPAEGTEDSYEVTVTATNDGGTDTETFILVITDGTTPPVVGGSENGSSEFLQQCLNSPAAGVASLLAVLGIVGAIGGPALEPMFKSIGAELDRQMRVLIDTTGGAHQPQWVRNINKGLNDAANAVDHKMVSNALFATAAIALASSPILCGMDNSSSGSSSSS